LDLLFGARRDGMRRAIPDHQRVKLLVINALAGAIDFIRRSTLKKNSSSQMKGNGTGKRTARGPVRREAKEGNGRAGDEAERKTLSPTVRGA
jgi:hypothetical protein